MSRTKRPEIVTTPPLMVARECASAAGSPPALRCAATRSHAASAAGSPIAGQCPSRTCRIRPSTGER